MCTVNKSVHTKEVWKLIEYTSYVYLCTDASLSGSKPSLNIKKNSTDELTFNKI